LFDRFFDLLTVLVGGVVRAIIVIGVKGPRDKVAADKAVEVAAQMTMTDATTSTANGAPDIAATRTMSECGVCSERLLLHLRIGRGVTYDGWPKRRSRFCPGRLQRGYSRDDAKRADGEAGKVLS
jgi:hypothetical protein